MQFLGLTGGFASGKSTVREMLRLLGADVLDADGIYHELLLPKDGKPSTLTRDIGARFPGVIRVDQTLDRQALGARVFDDPEERRALETLTHPRVAQVVALEVERLKAQGSLLVVYDVPLLFERRLELAMDGTLVVWVPRATQLQRMMARDHISREQAELRLKSQLPLDDKRKRATWVIDNSGPLSETRRQVERLWKQLLRR